MEEDAKQFHFQEEERQLERRRDGAERQLPMIPPFPIVRHVMRMHDFLPLLRSHALTLQRPTTSLIYLFPTQHTLGPTNTNRTGSFQSQRHQQRRGIGAILAFLCSRLTSESFFMVCTVCFTFIVAAKLRFLSHPILVQPNTL